MQENLDNVLCCRWHARFREVVDAGLLVHCQSRPVYAHHIEAVVGSLSSHLAAWEKAIVCRKSLRHVSPHQTIVSANIQNGMNCIDYSSSANQ